MSSEPPANAPQGGQTPPCLKVGAHICRGCPGWEAMLAAAAPGGPWRGALIHCACSGLSLRGGEAPGGGDRA